MINKVLKLVFRHLTVFAVIACCFASLIILAGPVISEAAENLNKINSLQLKDESGNLAVDVVTESPVGYRYTVYDSIDPTRIVVDFPGMDVSNVVPPTIESGTQVKEIKLSSFELTSGKLGRMEIVLDEMIPYDVALEGASFTVVLETPVGEFSEVESAMSQPVAANAVESEGIDNEPSVDTAGIMREDSSTSLALTDDASAITGVTINSSSLFLNADGHVGVFKYFKLGAPPRLVVDVYGVKAGFKEREFSLSNGFNLLRVGTYTDKIRFVLDASDSLPEYSVQGNRDSLTVAWGGDASDISEIIPVSSSVSAPSNVEAVEFDIEDGESLVRVTLSGEASVIEPTLKDGIVGFGVRNASISRALRRAIDASSFPSSIRLVTPYTVLVGDSQDVRFAVELKGPSEYSLSQDDNVVTLRVVNGPFAESKALSDETVAVDVPADISMTTPVKSGFSEESHQTEDIGAQEMSEVMTETSQPTDTDLAVSPATESALNEYGYAGQRISLVFDNADIRNILQLIAEVSNLNILAGDGVEGTITLRLIDVPCDQALDLILETKDLGMIRNGNIARILPKESIRAMDEAKFTAQRTREKLEDLEKAVITVSYTDLSNISEPAKEFLTDRGSITEDARNKKLIVKDIPKVIEEIKDLAAELDTPEKQVMIEARIVEVSTTANLDLGINWGIDYSQDASHLPTSDSTDGQVGLGGSFNILPSTVASGTAAGSAASFTWGQTGIDTTILDLRLSALETAGQVQIVSNPRIMTLNGEQAKISQGTQIPYQVISDGEVGTEMIEAALSLEVTPIINPDNTVILELLATNSSPGSTVSTAAGPSIDSKEAETKMLVKDGETMVIGGIYVEQEDTSESGVPILMHIPFLGHLFKSSRSNKSKAELMVFVTPRIIE
ncbi:MAG: hypothetical protein C0615_08440 [Desulfuromonas sp.]|nr:MAG: hypothetical protein C0615_08440 [Desulfuromonas sp.]